MDWVVRRYWIPEDNSPFFGSFIRRETETAIRAAKLAQEIADSRAGADQIASKGSIDLVTAADVACEDKIREELLRVFPDYPVIGEELGGEPVAGQPYWLVESICGTRHFASNIPLYCHNIALVENGEVTVAAVGVGKAKRYCSPRMARAVGFEQRMANEGFQCPTAARRSGSMVGRVLRTFCVKPFS